MATTIDKKDIVTLKSGHVAPGPPGISPSVPTPPAGPVPTPFAYVAKSADAKSGTANGKHVKVGKTRVLVKNTIMKMVPPVNKPSMPIGMGDIVTKATDLWAVVASGSDTVKAKGAPVAMTGSDVRLNAMEKQQIVQVKTMFVGAADFDLINKWGASAKWAKANKVRAVGDPVSATHGTVIDWDIDLSLPGIVPLVWRRAYSSSFRKRRGALGGGGWTHAFERWVEPHGDGARLQMDDGSELVIPLLEANTSAFLRAAALEIERRGTAWHMRDITTRLTYRFTPQERFGPALLDEIRDGYGNRIELRHERQRLAVVVDTAGREVRLEHDAKGRLARLGVWVADTLLREIAYRYGEGGELTEVERAPGDVTRYGYDGKHRLVAKHMPDGPTFRYAYDETDACTRTWSDEGWHPAGLDYEPAKCMVYVHNTPEPRVISHDVRGTLTREATPDGSWARELSWDDDGLLVGETNGAGETLVYERDERGHVVRRVDPGGRAWSWKYQDDLVVEQVDPGGATTRWRHDAHGGVTEVTNPHGVTLTVQRDNRGRITAFHGPDGLLTAYEYNDAHDVVRIAHATGGVEHEGYDALGRRIAQRDVFGREARIESDVSGRPTAVRYPDGTSDLFEWDARNHITRFTNQRGEAYVLDWEGTDCLRRITAPDGRAWTFAHDVLERLVAVETPRAERYELRHDRAGRVREETTFDGSTFSYQFDRAGRLARVELPGDAWLAYAYDGSGNPVEEDSPHGKRTFAWDAAGRVVDAVAHDYDGPIPVQMERDASGRVIADIQRGRPIRYEYDRSSRRATRTLPDGGATRYFYDAAGGLTAIEHQGYRVALQHDAAGREIRRHVYGAAIDICRAIDPGARWLDQWVTSRPDAAREPTHLARRRYTYDPGQRPLECVDGRWGREAYAYDPAGHLLGVEGKNAVRFDYDASGALVGMHPAVAPATSTWKTRAGNVLVRSAEASFTYDDARRRRRKIPDRGKPTEYQWDARSRLREVRLPSGTRVLFWYDAFGRRVRKLVAPAGPSIEELATGAAPPVARVVDYLWDGQVLAAELDSVRGARVFIHHPTTGVPLCQIEDGEAYTYVTDPMGVPRELIDTRGRIAWAGSISPFGLVRDVYRDPGTAEISPPFRQLGHYADEDTGLLYTLFRWFDPETARWLSIDPLLLLAGGNLFGLEASPTFTVDVLGLGTGFPVGVYSDSMPRLEKHEPLQATWGAGRFLGPRGTWPFQSENPVIGLGVGRHDDVHEGADDIFKARHGIAPEDISTLSAQQVLKAQEEAMLAAGVPKDKVDAVIAAAKKHAPKFICK